MLRDTALSPAWRLNFLANFFTGPLYRDLDARFGISRPEFVILYCLSQRPDLVARDICLVTGMPKNSISRAVSDLIGKGLVERRTDPADRRAKRLALRDAGRRLLDDAVPMAVARQTAMLAVLHPEEAAAWDALTCKLLRAMPGWVETDQG